MAKTAKTFVEVVEFEDNKLLLISVVNKKQLKEIYNLFEPLSRKWRGQYQSLAKAIVDAYNVRQNKQS
ncbi:hypothetical protein ACFLV7_15655 [Chloroflexota bacterium]